MTSRNQKARILELLETFFIQPLHALQLPLHLLHDTLRSYNLNVRSEGEQPAEEVTTQGDVNVGLRPAIFRGRNYGYVAAEAVDHDANHFVLEGEFDFGLVAAEHVKVHFGVFGEVELLEEVATDALVLQDADALHLVDPKMLQAVGFLVVGDQVVVLVAPGEGPRAHDVGLGALGNQRFLQVPLHVLKADLPVLGDGAVQVVHTVVNALVHGFDAALHNDLALQLLGLVFADKAGQFLDEGVGFLGGNEFGTLDGVHEEFQLRNLELLA